MHVAVSKINVTDSSVPKVVNRKHTVKIIDKFNVNKSITYLYLG